MRPSEKQMVGEAHRFERLKEKGQAGHVQLACIRGAVDYLLKENGTVEDNFSTYLEKNLSAMHQFLARRGIPFVAILQPDLAYSLSMGAVSEEAGEILRETSGEFYGDWLNAAGQLYPKAQAVIKRLSGKGVLAFDFTSLFEGKRAFYFTDTVHQKDPKALDLIAREVEEILTDHELLPFEKARNSPTL